MLVADRDRTEARSTASAAAVAAAVSAGFAVAIFVGAQVRIPLPWTPVPITLQTLVVYLGAAWLGAGRGVSGPLIYAAAAGVGLPVLSGWRGGFAALAGPTGGYVVGWLLAAYLLGRALGGRPASTRRVVSLMAVASVLVYTCGLLHLTLLLRVPFSEALWMGLWPFLPGDAVKIALAAAAYRRWPNPLSTL